MTSQHPPMWIEKTDSEQPAISVLIEGDRTLESIDQQYLRVESIQGQEGISQPFQMTVELRADDTSKQPERGPVLDGRYIGRWARLCIQGRRYFRGLITELALAAPGCYTLTVQSPLQILSLRNRYHIYTQCNISDLLKEVFAQELLDNRFRLKLDFDDSLTLTRIQDWLQAGETDMDFIQRIIAKFCIHYFFVHEKDQLTLVFSNTTATTEKVSIPGYQAGPLPLRYSYTSIDKLGLQQGDLFCDLRYSVKMMPAMVRTMLSRIEAAWDTNKMAISDNTPWIDNQPHGNTEYQCYRYYDYGADTDEARGQFTKICQQIQTEAGTLTGNVTSPLLSPGYSFSLWEPVPDEGSMGRPEFSGEVFIVTKIQHKMSATGPYSGSVEATQLYTGNETLEQTLLTPFSMQNTHQGSVIAKVIEHTPPASSYFVNKSNFQPEDGQVSFDGDISKARGCLVRLATGKEYWVTLSKTSQTVPEINSLVTIGRGDGESEQPELQQVLSSHGSKTVTPPGRRNASWQVNGSWGSSYSTSYGDSISIRYGHNSATDLSQASALVESAYDKTGMDSTLYGNSSYSKGGGWSLSLSDNADAGVLSASVSQGSSYNESHALISYGVSHTGTSQSFSRTGKSVNRSVTGEYDGNLDLNNPSFIGGHIPEQSIVDIANQLNTGDSYNENYTKGRSVNLSGNGAEPPGWDDTSAMVFSNSKTVGKVVNKSTHIGDNYNTSSQTGNTTTSNTTNGNSNNTNTTTGNSTGTTTTAGDTNNTSTVVGNRNEISTSVGLSNAITTNIGASNRIENNLSLSNSIATNLSASNNISTTIGASNTVETFIGAKNSVSTQLAATNSTSTTIGASNTTETFIGVKSNITTQLAGSSNISTTIGANSSIDTFIGSKMNIATQLASVIEIETTMGTKLKTENNLSTTFLNEITAGSVIKMQEAPAEVQMKLCTHAKISETQAEILNGIKAIL
ncbi:hypothetical protein HUF18_14745 [Thalassolituus sp. ST750PaO-4]|uniref:contractile injection system protein, VgrG/Pvc8 family n=1 Tax=Thalassolituus sp. ST750PaO-4 TaxID=2742965 RepID=UPI001CE38A82|nr:contractile injection system protein, VgrG/Pvc8 family [Thalassolituus sp. ST750PaO-4]MCA6061034.1 hypothetical protein [Thalassolituus sp. ST750PaO-4]